MTFDASITKRARKRTLQSGQSVVQVRYVVSFKHPVTGRRSQLFFRRHSDAVAKRNTLIAEISTHKATSGAGELTVAQAIEHWLQNRQGSVKHATWRGYRQTARYVVGPLLIGTACERRRATMCSSVPPHSPTEEMLGTKRVLDLTTADIRSWHQRVATHVSTFTANVARKCLKAALALAAEDFNLRTAPMPTQLGRGRTKTPKAILSPAQIVVLIEHARKDVGRGLYYAFPFLTGVRPSEQLALLWEDVDLANNIISIRRMQEQNATLTSYTKTFAGFRQIPICPLLQHMLAHWQGQCPTRGARASVFPRLGSKKGARWQVGGTLTYENFRAHYWRPVFAKLGLPYVTPHSARHSFISTLQLQGIEVGLVAKLAGHANAAVTLSHYTHALRGGEAAVEALEKAWTPQTANSSPPESALPPTQRS
jgi:integrase